VKLSTLTFFAVLAVAFTASANAAVPAAAAPHSPSASSVVTTIERLALQPSVPPYSPRSSFHLTTTSSCDAAQTQCVASCSSQSGQAAQNCISDCHDIRSVCQ